MSVRWAVLFAVSACGRRPPIAAQPDPSGFAEQLAATLDPGQDPCTDFYRYACGGWLTRTPLPPDRPSMTRAFVTIEDANEALVRGLLDEAAANPSDALRAKLGAFWTACNDQGAIDARGADPIRPIWAEIDALADKDGLLPLVSRLQQRGLARLFAVWIDADAKNPGLAIVQLWQGGTGLPDRSYYLDAQHAELKRAYEDHVARLLALAGAADAAVRAHGIVAFETRLAQAQWDEVDLRDAERTYNKVDRAGLQALTPGLDWDGWLAARGRPELTQFNVTAPSFFEGLARTVAETDLAVLKAYLAFHALSAAAGDLAAPLDAEVFRFHGQTLYGQKEQRARWKRCVEEVDRSLGDLLSQAYVAAAFRGDSKPVALDMIGRIEHAFEQGLDDLAWMDPDTRQRAIEKARAITNKVGYPETWREYPFEVAPSDHFGNVLRAREHDDRYWMSKAEKPVDPDTWLMTAATVNAYYNPPQNEIAFPAGILQAPFFRADWPKAANFGAIGSVMGHEITHGFDDEGRKYDGEGRLTDWWAPGAVEAFEEAASCVSDLYSGFEVEVGHPVDGELTLGENIADLGGVRTAFRAYRGWVAEHGPEPKVAGLTGEQQLFVAYAQAWCTLAAPEFERVQVKTGVHSPGEFRVNGVVSQLPEFAETFRCAEGTPMRPKERCEVW